MLIFWILDCYGKIVPEFTRILIGEKVLLSDIMIKISDPEKRKRLEDLKNNGEKSIVVMGENGIYPGSLASRVVSSFEELEEAINKIHEAYQSLEITISVKTKAQQTKK